MEFATPPAWYLAGKSDPDEPSNPSGAISSEGKPAAVAATNGRHPLAQVMTPPDGTTENAQQSTAVVQEVMCQEVTTETSGSLEQGESTEVHHGTAGTGKMTGQMTEVSPMASGKSTLTGTSFLDQAMAEVIPVQAGKEEAGKTVNSQTLSPTTTESIRGDAQGNRRRRSRYSTPQQRAEGDQ